MKKLRSLPSFSSVGKEMGVVVFFLFSIALQAQEKRTPPMGWMSWNLFSEHINEQLLREMADAMVSGGYRDAGYEYLFIDDCWQGGRDNRNNLIPDPEKFPSGIKALADYVHARGLKLGIYSDAAQLTCAGRTASYGFEEQDARTFASWGIDYLKYDYCNAPADSAEAHRRYKIMGDALAKSGRRIALGVCEWGQLHPELWAAEAGGTVWRTTYDVRDMWVDKVHQGGMGILDIVNVTAPLYSYARPGHWNDMDMLVVGLEGRGGPSSDLGGTGCTYAEYQSQMSLWCMEASPLAMTHDLRNENAETRRILLNKEIIAINQDALGKAAERKVYKETYQIFVRPLTGNRWAVAVLNTAEQPQVIRVDFSALGIAGRCSVRDVWAHKQIARKAASWKGRMAVHETKVFVLK